jgi:MerR family copper efflux transcriptional regulator
MDGLRISELAGRSGFSASALRYYEQAGLLPVPARTSGGYRSYRPETLDRLRFIARAKQLGLPLEEIRELAAVWDGGSCAPVQRGLAGLLDAKITEVRARIAELSAFAAQLSAVRDGLGAHTPAGACDDGCGCLAGAAAVLPAGRQPLPLLVDPAAAAGPD